MRKLETPTSLFFLRRSQPVFYINRFTMSGFLPNYFMKRQPTNLSQFISDLASYLAFICLGLNALTIYSFFRLSKNIYVIQRATFYFSWLLCMLQMLSALTSAFVNILHEIVINKIALCFPTLMVQLIDFQENLQYIHCRVTFHILFLINCKSWFVFFLSTAR